MTHPLLETVRGYIAEPIEGLILENVRIGRLKLGKMIIRGREAAYSAQDILDAAFQKTQRVRSGRHGTRYHDPLPVGAPARLLSIEIEDHLKHLERRGLRPETIEGVARTLKMLRIACGDVPVSRIDHHSIHKVWDLLRWAPPGLLRRPNVAVLTFDQVVAEGEALNVDRPAQATMEKHRRFLVSFFKQLQAAGAIRLSPMDSFGKLRKDLTRASDKTERYFPIEDLERMFDPKTFVPWAMKYPHRWWCPILALYTGARINELAQLKLIDIGEEHGQRCIFIQQTEDSDLPKHDRNRSRQSLKGESAIRTIPIHPALIAAGFLEFVEDMRECGHPRLFPHLSAGVNQRTGETNARYSQGVLNQFSTYLKQLGFPKGVGFHAFRHTFITGLSQHNVTDADIALLTGHSKGGDYKVVQVYKKKISKLEAEKKRKALAVFQPAILVPTYARGQFAKKLAAGAKFYP